MPLARCPHPLDFTYPGKVPDIPIPGVCPQPQTHKYWDTNTPAPSTFRSTCFTPFCRVLPMGSPLVAVGDGLRTPHSWDPTLPHLRSLLPRQRLLLVNKLRALECFPQSLLLEDSKLRPTSDAIEDKERLVDEGWGYSTHLRQSPHKRSSSGRACLPRASSSHQPV